MSISIFEIVILFILFCLIWIITNAINQLIIGKFQKKLVQEKIDTAYLQISKYVVRAIAESKAFERK